ncbi:MAG: hypothetical protein FIB07_11625 [Candidatus Methanoperedens sp.]|nr:hypothetical protein [Candidatus Methanoperedens sp.]
MVIVVRGYISIFMALLFLINIAAARVDDKTTDGNKTETMDNISVALDHIFISSKNNSIDISEIVVFRNEGKEIYYSTENHTFFAISTPMDAKNLKTEAMECCLVQDEGIVYMDPMKSIKPGENFEMKISYTLIPQDKEYVFNKSAIYNTSSISMFIDRTSGMDIEEKSEIMTLSGKEYKVVNFNNLLVGENVSIPVKLAQEPDYRYAGIGLFFLVSTGLIYCFRDKISWRRKKEPTLEELEIEKRKIFNTIHGFEKHAGTEHSEEYRKLMEEYRQKVIRIFINIDNLKNKSQSGPVQTGMKQIK